MVDRLQKFATANAVRVSEPLCVCLKEAVMRKAVKTRAQWAAEIRSLHKQAIDGVLKIGRTLIAAGRYRYFVPSGTK